MKSTQPKYTITTSLRGEVYTRLKKLRELTKEPLQEILFAGIKAKELEHEVKNDN